MINFPLTFMRDPKTGRSSQEEFFAITKRNSCFSGGYGNGKSYAGSMKILTLMCNFPGYRACICRLSGKDLKRSTMSTFFKICPPELYDERKGGKRADSLEYLKLINGSELFWMHLDDADEGTVRGLEINSVLIDQAEEVSENMYLHLSARVGRWDMASVPESIITPDWAHKCVTCGKRLRGKGVCCTAPNLKPMAPSYLMILCNPDSELHWIYRRYHPDSLEFQQKYHKNHEMISASSIENPALDQEVLDEMLSNDPVWVRRYVYGVWGIPGGAVHELQRDSLLRPGINIPWEFLNHILRSGKLYRVLDHGDASPTCCLWFCAWKSWFFCYREYYEPEKLVSDHRSAIDALSVYPGTEEKEHYANNWADPDIFKKHQQKYGGFWCVADEYRDNKIDAPALTWIAADNNELATRNRLNEYLRLSPQVTHPITGASPAPQLYFLEKSPEYPNGCFHSILQLRSQKRLQIGTENGKPIFSDERDEKIPDHAYDPTRYFVAMHPAPGRVARKKMPAGSFLDVRKEYLKLKRAGATHKIWGSGANVFTGVGESNYIPRHLR